MAKEKDNITRIHAGEAVHKKATNKRTLKIIGVVLLVLILIGLFSGGGDKTDTSNTAQGNNQANESTQDARKTSLSESEAERYCQDDNLTPILSGNAQYSDIDMIDVWNYNINYMEYGEDKDGYPVMLLTWSGKSGDEALSFSCYVSGTKDNPTLHYLSMGGETMRGDPELSSIH